MQRQLPGADLKRRVENAMLNVSIFYDKEKKSLSIQKTNVNDADIEFIASWLAQHPDTVTLNLNNNLISDAGAKQLAIILQQYTAIKTLNLQYNRIGNDGVNLLIDALNSIKKRSIQLDLTWNQAISQKGINQLKLYSMREGSSHHHHVLFHDYVQPTMVSDCPKLEDLAFKALIKRGSLFKDDDKISDITTSQPKRIASVLEQHITKLMPEFLQAVVDENDEVVKKLLTICPELLICEPPKNLVIQSKLTLPKFYAEKALTMTAKRKQFKMFALLYSYFNKLDDQDNAVEDETALAMNAAVCAAKAEGIAAWKCYDMQNAEIIITEEYSYYVDYVESLINILSRETFPNGSEPGKRLSDETELALETLLNILIPKQAVKLDDYLDIELFLLAAYRAYKNEMVLQTSDKQSSFCIRVIGLIESVLPPETVKILCTGLVDIASAMEAAINQGKNITGCMVFSTLAKQHKFQDGEFFYRLSRDSKRGLGFDFLCGVFGSMSVIPRVLPITFGEILSSKNSKFLEEYKTMALQQTHHQACKS